MKGFFRRRVLCAVLVFFTVFSIIADTSASFVRAAAQQPSLSAKSAVLIDFDSGKVLYSHNANERMGMASTTKIMTALTVLRLVDIDKTLTVPREAVGVEGSSVYLCEGERLTVRELLYALLLSSANDAAVALAVCSAGTVEKFADEMNAYAAELGLKNTSFTNPHGLYDDGHYTTAKELAVISRAALANTELRRIFSTYKATIPHSGTQNGRLVVNHNKLLRTYEGAIGMKTGFTKKTGRCLVSAAQRNGLTLIAVTLCAPDDWRDHALMLDYGFESFERVCLVDMGELEYSMPTADMEHGDAVLKNTSALYLTLPKDRGAVSYTVSSCYRFLYLPLREGFHYATVTATVDGEQVSSPLALFDSD